LRAARVALAARWGDATPRFTRAAGDLAALAPPPSTDDLLARITNNPDVARWTTELAARDAAVALEHARAVPDLGVGAGPRYFSDTNDVGVVFELSLPLPFFDRNQGGIAEARALRGQADAQRRATELAARSAVATAAEALRAAFERARVLRDDLVPGAQRVLDDATRAYRTGAVRYLDVLEARRTVFDIRDQYLAALADYHHARIDVDRLVGAPTDATEPTP
jgi:cobalt-zinc-cadmium efflux system outer membrane protein